MKCNYIFEDACNIYLPYSNKKTIGHPLIIAPHHFGKLRNTEILTSLKKLQHKMRLKHVHITIQGEEKVVEKLMYIGHEVTMKRGKSVKSIVPILKHDNVKEKDMKDILSSEENSTPWLHLFFTNNVFITAHVARDKHEINLQAGDVMLALLVYISCFFVYRVGYGKEYCQYLSFFQQALIGIPYTGN